MTPAGGKSFFTAAELAELKLPGLPTVKRKVNERALSERWALKFDQSGMPLHRQRTGRGGGVEYHHSLLPAAARVELVKRGLAGSADVHAAPPPAALPGSRWAWFEGQSDKVKAEAARRLAVLSDIARAEEAGLTRSAAVALVSGDKGVGKSTLWAWVSLVDGIRQSDWLPHLAPVRRGGGAEAGVDDLVWQMLKSDWLRFEKPTWESCYYRAQRFAASRGIEIPHSRTLWRKLEREVPAAVIVLRRDGVDKLRQTLPAQERTVADLHAMKLVNIDGHKWDVFVRFPNGTIQRPMMVAIQDVFSRKFLSRRVGETESAVLTRLAFADLFRDYGIPEACLLDNGRAFASKWITGGAKTRFRFKILEDEPTGLLPAVGINPHWATPYRGSSKPIERGFRDFCDHIAKHPEFAGAYTGNKPDAKPENYGSTAIPLAHFIAVVDREIAAHNARPGRRTEMARGMDSFDDVFNRSYADSRIGKATEEQLRLALLTADEVSTNRQTGEIRLYDNRYWAPELSEISGTRVIARFDPDDLTKPLHVYSRDGRFLASAPLIERTGFLSHEGAQTRAKQIAEHRKATKKAAQMQDLMEAADIAALLPHPVEAPLPAPAATRMIRHRGNAAVAVQAAPRTVSEPSQTPLDRMAKAARRLRVVD